MKSRFWFVAAVLALTSSPQPCRLGEIEGSGPPSLALR